MLTPRGTSHLNLKVSETKCFCVSRKWSILVAVSLAYSNWRPWAPRLPRNTIPALPTYQTSSRSPEHFTKWRGERFLGKHRQRERNGGRHSSSLSILLVSTLTGNTGDNQVEGFSARGLCPASKTCLHTRLGGRLSTGRGAQCMEEESV